MIMILMMMRRRIMMFVMIMRMIEIHIADVDDNLIIVMTIERIVMMMRILDCLTFYLYSIDF